MSPISKITGTLIIACLCNSNIYGQAALPAAYPASIKLNYVREWIPTAPISDPSIVPSRPVEEVKRMTTYADGLGRQLQTVSKQATPAKKDMVNVTIYDEYGRKAYSYLPFVSTQTPGGSETTNEGSFKLNPFQQQQAFMQSQYGGQGETYYYGQVDYEASPLNRVQQTFAAGNSWVGSRGTTSEKSVQQRYLVNTTQDEVRLFTIGAEAGAVPVSTANYAAGKLYKNQVVDERGNKVIEFRDMGDRVILKKVQADNTVSDGHSGWLCTYYVYDDFGLLRFVLSPKATELYLSGTALPAIAAELCFQYEYDSRHRMIKKTVPGAAYVTMVYDGRDRLVMTQDGNLRTTGKWLVTKYDELNRPVETGLWVNANTQPVHAAAAASSTSYPVTSGSYEQLTQHYYDNYSWVAGTGSNLTATIDATNLNNSSYFETNYNAAPYFALPLTVNYSITGMPTGSKTKILGTTNDYLYMVLFYDTKGSVIQSQSTNISGAKDIATTQYDFSGKPLRTLLQHAKGGTNPQVHTVLTKMNYDHAGRLLTIKKTVSSVINGSTVTAAEKTIVQNSYDELGQLKIKKIGNKPGGTGELESLSYDYNIRGWLLGVNRDYAKDVNSNNYFGFDLGYDKAGNGIIGNATYVPQYNGNISGTVWKSKGDGEKRKYDFTYDNANRLLKADFNQYTGGSFSKNAGVDFTVKMGDGNDYSSAYDANGNIKRMQQWGLKINASAAIDDMIYNYNAASNKLLNVIDAMNDAGTKLGDFRASAYYQQSVPVKNNATQDYTYDINGNLTKDRNKDIKNISYNFLNLPVEINVDAGYANHAGAPVDKGKITYIYDAAGNKLQKTVVEFSGGTYQPPKITTYINGAVYENDVLQFLPQEEGRIRFKPAAGNTAASFQYDYFIKDHLGNVRLVLTDEQQTDPYPPASMETAQAATEEALYTNLPQTRVAKPSGYPTDTYTSPNDNVAKTNGSGNKIGPAIILKVMAGDKFNIRVSSWYKTNGNQPGTPVNPLADLLTALTSSFNGIGGAHGATGTEIYNTGVFTTNAQSFLNDQVYNSSKPKAFVNWLLLDEQFKYVSSSSGAEQVGNDQALTTHVKTDLPVNKSGYLYIYVSNETPNIDVFFDNLQVTHTRGAILEETHYYPFGLTMAGISSKAAGGMDNKKKYQQYELNENFDLDIYESFYRTYDPQLGRFLQIDPEPKYNESLYLGLGNNPVLNVDPLGNDWWDIVVGTVYGVVDNIVPGSNLRATYKPTDPSDYNNALRSTDYTMLAISTWMQADGANRMKQGAVLSLAGGPQVGLPMMLEGGIEVALGANISVNASANIAKGYNYGEDPIVIADEHKVPRDQVEPPKKPGDAPISKEDGHPIEIHHEGQNPDGPFKEMTRTQHRGKGNDKINHPNKNKPSKIDRNRSNRQRREYWKKEFENYWSKPIFHQTPKG